MRERARELHHERLQGGCQQDLYWRSMDHRGAPCLGNDGGWHFHHSTKRRPLQATDRSQTEACRSAYDSRAPHLTLWLGIARSHPIWVAVWGISAGSFWP